MKKHSYFLTFTLMSCLFLQSCTRTSDDVWEDTKSAGRYLQRSAKAMAGYHSNSRQINSRTDFEGIQDEYCEPDACYDDTAYQNTDFQNTSGCNYSEQQQPEYDFIPLDDPSNQVAMADYLCRQPSETPGELGSSIPGIQAFQDPAMIPQLMGIFKTIYFGYDSSLIKGQANLEAIHQIANYLRKHPNVYVFVEGHTDERGPQAYNLALGSRRANTVRDFLISEGVNPDNLFTISYGKERPVVMENHEEGWSKNRRAEFKVYAR